MISGLRLAAHHSVTQQLSNQEESSGKLTDNNWSNNMHRAFNVQTTHEQKQNKFGKVGLVRGTLEALQHSACANLHAQQHESHK